MLTPSHKRSCQGKKEMEDTLSGQLWTKSNCRNCIVGPEKIKSIKKLFMRLFVSVLLLSWIMSFPGFPFYCITSSAAASWGEGIYLQICQKQESKEKQSDFPIPLTHSTINWMAQFNKISAVVVFLYCFGLLFISTLSLSLVAVGFRFETDLTHL